MTSTTHEARTMNTPQPYGGRELGDSGHSTTGVNPNTIPAASTHGVGAAAGATSKSNLSSSQNQPQPPSVASQNSSNGEHREGADRGADGIQGGRKDTNGVADPAEEEGGAARGSGTEATEGLQTPTGPEGGYPEQLHAGKLDGLGPEYRKMHGVTMSERIQGLKEEIKGTVKRDPELKKTGKERMTGELKRKEQEGDKKDKKEPDPKSTQTDTEKTDDPGLTEHPQAHPTVKGREEQTASVQPEGTGSSAPRHKA